MHAAPKMFTMSNYGARDPLRQIWDFQATSTSTSLLKRTKSIRVQWILGLCGRAPGAMLPTLVGPTFAYRATRAAHPLRRHLRNNRVNSWILYLQRYVLIEVPDERQDNLPTLESIGQCREMDVSQLSLKRKLGNAEAPNIEELSKEVKLDHWTGVHSVVTSASPFPTQRREKSFKFRTIPEGFPPPLIAKEPGSKKSNTISFSQFWSSSPPADVGVPGDMFFVISSPVHSVFVKTSSWIQWEGMTPHPLDSQITHPGFPNMVVWFTESDITWAPSKKFTLKILHHQNDAAWHPVVITADDCVRSILQNIPLAAKGMTVGSRRTGGSLVYWKTEYERAKLGSERCARENADLKDQIAELQCTRTEAALTGIETIPYSDADVAIVMRDALIGNSALRRLVLQGLSPDEVLWQVH
jgi:hypothetical protein